MTLLTLNTLSNKTISSKEEVDGLLLQLVYGIKDFLSHKEYKGSRFYTEERDIHSFEIISGYQFQEAMKSLKREILDFFSQFLDKQCDNDCLNKITDKEMENILNGDLYFDDEPFAGQNYIILSYCLEKKTFLLSFGKDRWDKYKVIANRTKEDGNSEKVILDNIANKEHVVAHYNQKQLDKLPTENIIYSDYFKDWLLSIEAIHRDKTIEKLHFVASENFEGRRENNIAPISTEKIEHLKEIIVGSAGGLRYAQIRVLFKPYNKEYLILNGFIKQNESNQDKKYDEEIEIANNVFKDMLRKRR